LTFQAEGSIINLSKMSTNAVQTHKKMLNSANFRANVGSALAVTNKIQTKILNCNKMMMRVTQ
jgi:hypothetical protein